MKPYFSLEKLDLYHGDASVLETFEKGLALFVKSIDFQWLFYYNILI